jgi:hypothetical protein
MPIDISMHESGRYIVSVFRGKIGDAELRSAYEAFYAQVDVPRNTPELIDLSGADLSPMTHAGLVAFARWARELLHKRGDTVRKSAYYIPSQLGRSKLVIYEVLVQESPEVMQVFSRRDEALEWLLAPPGVSPVVT